MSVIWQICAGSILFLWRPLRTPSLCSRQGTLASVLGGFFKHLQLRCEMVHPTAFLFLYFIAKDGRNEGAESYPSNLNSASTWQAISLFWSRSDPPGAFIWHQSLHNSAIAGSQKALWYFKYCVGFQLTSHIKYATIQTSWLFLN